MPWAVLCRDRDDVDTAALRRAERDRHFAYVESILDRILVAGPAGPAPGGTWRASLFVYATEDRTEAGRLLHADPYHRAGIYAAEEFFYFMPAAGAWPGGTLWSRGSGGAGRNS